MNRLRASVRTVARRAAVDQPVEVPPVLLRQVRERGQVVRHPGDDLLLRQPLGQRDLDRAVEGQHAACTLSNAARVFRIARLQPITVRRNRFRVTSIFLASEISSSRVNSGISAICERYMRIGSLLHLATSGGGGAASRRRFALGESRAAAASSCSDCSRRRRTPCRRLVDQVDALFLQGDQQIVQLIGIDFFVGQVLVDFVVGQIALGLALGDQFLQVLVE